MRSKVSAEISELERQEILLFLGTLPSKELLSRCLTVGQKARYSEVQEEMFWLQQELAAFFNGDASVLSQMGEVGEHLQKLKDYLLQTYELIRNCWKWISPILDELMGTKNPFQKPGDLLCLVLQDLADGKVAPFLKDWYTYQPKELDKLARLQKKIDENPSTSERAKQKYLTDLNSVRQGLDQYTITIRFIESACRWIIDNNLCENKVIPDQWRRYTLAKKLLINSIEHTDVSIRLEALPLDKGKFYQVDKQGAPMDSS